MPDQRHRWGEEPSATLCGAREWVLAHREDGAYCPCCGQFAKLYRRKLSSSMAYALVLIDRYFREQPHGWLHVPSYLTEVVPARCGATFRGGDWAKLVYWELIRENKDGHTSISGGPRAGYYRMTEQGRLFVRNRLLVPKHALVYDGEPLGFTKETVSINDALGSRFDYGELMAAAPPDPPDPQPDPPPDPADTETEEEEDQLGLFAHPLRRNE